jgi:hypothetical protein
VAFVLLGLYYSQKFFLEYPALQDAVVVEGKLYIDKVKQVARSKERPYRVQTKNGTIVLGRCLSIYGNKCPWVGSTWQSMDGKESRMWVVDDIAIQMMIDGVMVMPYEKYQTTATSIQWYEVTIFGIPFFWWLYRVAGHIALFHHSASRVARSTHSR